MSFTVLLSVSEKTGIVEFAKQLHALGGKLLSTGGTAKLLADAGLPVVEVSDCTGFPEMLDGRVKTLHPNIHAGLLARRDKSEHMAALQRHGISTIDMLVVNLYPFEATVAQAGCTLPKAIENIDIGGPAMVRSGAKNWRNVVVVTHANQYETVLYELQTIGNVCLETKFGLSVAAFNRITQYDSAISAYLSSITLNESDLEDVPQRQAYPEQYSLVLDKVQDLRYGENPHQRAAFYRDLSLSAGNLANAQQLQGKELSYNNIADADAAWECVKQFGIDNPADAAGQTACVIVKHANPCGVAVNNHTLGAYNKAFATDSTSAFGGIIAFNREVDKATAEVVAKKFVEVLMAPSFTLEARTIFQAKPNVRLLQIDLTTLHTVQPTPQQSIKRVGGGVLVQDADMVDLAVSDLKVVTIKQPTDAELQDLFFAWKVAKFVKSNAIVFCKNGQTRGIGAGQMSRLDSARIAIIKAEHAQLSLQATAVASDAFFPFRDGLDVVADAGASCVIQPGGSMRDQEVIDAANERGMAMVFTGIRHFRH